ncbi:unnamed protein product [Thelazia callipaeda]|uniref:Transmembrane protein C9orf5 n=1 Tax=Thelazia callipaeda TaxID=103827 RepID=A0A0N5D5T9_THECL|nr:unnamed protein product [Thelazia callipaeda]
MNLVGQLTLILDMNLVGQLTTGIDHKMPLQFALCNILLLTLAGICLAGLYAIYQMLYMFITPLMWATLVGTIIFPVKKHIKSSISGWMSRTDEEEIPFLLSVAFMPYHAVTSFTDTFITYMTRREGVVVLAVYLILKVLRRVTLISLVHLIGDLYSNIDHFIQLCSKNWVLVLMSLYFAAFCGWLCVQDARFIHKKLARLISAPLWLYGLAKISSFFGPFAVIIMTVASVVLATIAVGILTTEEITVDDAKKTGEVPSKITEESNDENVGSEKLTGNFYLQGIMLLCLLEFAVLHDFVICVAFIMAFFTMLRKIAFRNQNMFSGFIVSTQTGLKGRINDVLKIFYQKIKQLMYVTVSGPVRNFFRFFFSKDYMIKNFLRRALDDISTVLVMLLLVFISLFIAFITLFEVHSEGVHLIRLGANLMLQQPEWIMDYAKTYTGNELEENDINNYVEQGYLKGREWMVTNIRSIIPTKDPVRGELLQIELIELLDKLYKVWETRNEGNILPSGNSTVEKGWMDHVKVFTSLDTLKEEVIELIKANIDMIMSIAQSIWSFTSANISTLGTVMFAVIAIVIDFGLEIFNFFLETIVFLTALYYLLASSHDIWLPMKWLNDVLPLSHGKSGSVVYNTGDIITAIEHAIRSLFYLFSEESVMLAAIFAAVPIVSPYFVFIFGFLELYFMKHETAVAILFVMAGFAPKVFAETAFYNELSGSHPYVTGLAIIGGMYWLGLQGAIIGPILLCSMIVLLDLCKNFAQSYQ